MRLTGERLSAPLLLGVLAAASVAAGGSRAADVPTCDGAPPTIVGTGGDDRLTGTPGDDVIASLGGDDQVDGGGGNDRICTGGGNDSVIGGAGNDHLNGGAGVDLADYGCEEPSGDCPSSSGLRANLGKGWVSSPETGHDEIATTRTSDPGRPSSTIEDLIGSSGDDFITGSHGDDDLLGGPGNDTIRGGPGADGIEGGPGDDDLDGGAGFDRLRFVGTRCAADGTGVEVSLSGGTSTGDGVDTLQGDSFKQVIGSSCADVLIGSDFRDTLYGSAGTEGNARTESDVLYGRSGNDLLVPDTTASGLIDSPGDGAELPRARGRDLIYGGLGDDTVDYGGSPAPVKVDLSVGRAQIGERGEDELTSVEAVYGSGFADDLTGDSYPNLLVGGDGNDGLDGGESDDYLDGGLGDDTIAGGEGDADFVDYQRLPGRVGRDLCYATSISADLAADPPNVDVTTTAGSIEEDSVGGVEGVSATGRSPLIDGPGQCPSPAATAPAGDRLTGDSAANFLFAYSGDDGVIRAGRGRDVLLGGTGRQALDGGAGIDRCTGSRHERTACERGGTWIPQLLHLTKVRALRENGAGQLDRLEKALDEMRFHKLIAPPTVRP